MNVNNILVEELGSKYKDKRYKNIYQIQIDYKQPPISKMLYLDKEAITALNSKVNDVIGNINMKVEEQVTIKKSQKKKSTTKKVSRSKQGLNG